MACQDSESGIGVSRNLTTHCSTTCEQEREREGSTLANASRFATDIEPIERSSKLPFWHMIERRVEPRRPGVPCGLPGRFVFLK